MGRSELEHQVPSLQTTHFLFCTLVDCGVPHGGMLRKPIHARCWVVDWCVLWRRSGDDEHRQGLGQAMQKRKEEASIQRELLLLLRQGTSSAMTIQARQPETEPNWKKRGDPTHQEPHNSTTQVPSNNFNRDRRLPRVERGRETKNQVKTVWSSTCSRCSMW
jgi:hypothetical protein